MKIAVGSDHAGFNYKQKIKQFLDYLGHEVYDFGTDSDQSVDYPLFIRPVAEAVAAGKADRGIVLGGSGNGEAMVANRVPGIRCALCWNIESARLARRHNNANVLSLGERMISEKDALEIVKTWLETPFDGGRHLRRINQIDHKEGPAELSKQEGSTRKDDEGMRTTSETYDVFISFRYIVYSEGKNAIEFKVNPNLKGPSVIQVPSPKRWKAKLPEWARDRRKEILDRIMSKCSHLKCKVEEIQ